ncbi:MAG TPA: hypothetical protein VMU14_01960 [Acidimicrobiales bacterium]|nr:hypothetical protein [Acidimicrobiales bacterium]
MIVAGAALNAHLYDARHAGDGSGRASPGKGEALLAAAAERVARMRRDA